MPKGVYKGNKGKIPWNKGRKVSEKERLRLLSLNKNKVFSIEYRRKLSEAHKRDRHWNWKGGITAENKQIRSTFEYKLWREAVFKRDKYTCVWCKLRSGNGRAVVLNADHIKPFCDYPELRFSIDNGRTLCKDCHSTTDTYKGRSNRKNI